MHSIGNYLAVSLHESQRHAQNMQFFDVYKVLGCENNKNQVNLQSKCDDQFPGKFISKNVWNCSRMHATMEQA